MNKKEVLVGITGYREKDWKNKLREIEKLKIEKVALFLERFNKIQRNKIYQALLSSNIKEIPLVHIRHDTIKEEMKFLKKNFKSKYFTIHEDHFKFLNRWKGFYKYLYIEMNMDNFVSKLVKVNKIGGFCIDLSHFKSAEEAWTKEFEYIMKRKKTSKYFACNHLNGYSYEKNTDLHTITSLKNFNYLKTLPKFLFGKIIAIETENNIKDQLKFKKYILKILNKNKEKKKIIKLIED